MWIYMFIDDALDEFEDTVTIDLFFTAFLCAPSGFFHHFVCNIKIVGYKKSCKLETMFYSFKVNKENLIISNIFIYVYKYIYYFLLLPYVTARIVENSTWKWC